MSVHLNSISRLEWGFINKPIIPLSQTILCNININGNYHVHGKSIIELVGNTILTMDMMNSIPMVLSDLKGVFNE